MYQTIEQVESSSLPEYYKSQLRTAFGECRRKKNKYHNKHVYVCCTCSSLLSLLSTGLKIRSHKTFTCPKCGTVKKHLFFQSKKEAAYFFRLEILVRAGTVLEFKRQIPYVVILNSGEKITYVLDFLVSYTDNHIEYIDVKGKRLPEYLLKKKLVEDRFQILIKEV